MTKMTMSKINTLISDEDLRSLFNKKVRKASNNHYITDCPFCNKEGHFYINYSTQQWDCKKCGEDGNIIKLLKFLDKLYFLGEFKTIVRGKVKLLSDYKEEDEEGEEVDLKPPTRKLPLGFQRMKKDKYWSDRGFTDDDFEKYEIGETDLISKLRNYSIIAIKEDGNNVGYIARIRKSKSEIKTLENKTGFKVARFRNDKGAKFSNLLLGYDEINKNTHTVILIEGYPDKVTLDRTLNLDSQDEIKCCVTFGKKISKSQVLKLLAKGIKNIILIFDYDAIREMKKQGEILKENFDRVLIGFTFERDINDSTEQEVLEVFHNLKSVAEFKRTTVKTLR